MGYPVDLFNLAQENVIIAANLAAWKYGQCSFKDTLINLIKHLQSDCNKMFDEHDLKSKELENTLVILEKNLVPHLQGKSDIDQQSELIDVIIYISKIRFEIIKLVHYTLERRSPPNIMVGEKEFKFVGKLPD